MAVRILFLTLVALATVMNVSTAVAQPAPAAKAAAARAQGVDRVVAIVNDEAITLHDIDEAKRIVLQQMKQARSILNIVILDACRSDPFEGRSFKATKPGLAQMEAPATKETQRA